MKRLTYFALVLILAVATVGCNKKKIDQLEHEKAALQAEKMRQDSLLNDFMSTFNEFEDNLEAIKEKESLITMGDENPEYRTEGKEKVIEDIQMINDLLDQNRQIIEELTAKAEKAEGTSSEYRRAISRLKKQLVERDGEITELKEQLVALDYRIEDLNGRVDTLTRRNTYLAQTTEAQTARITQQEDSLRNLDSKVSEQDVALHTAYFVTGTTRELKDQSVINKEGGFIGIGATKQLASDFNPSAFNKIDIREMTEIPVATRKPEVLTVHPASSYEFKDLDDDKEYDILEIKNPAEFWKTSRYLVVMTK
ncbi:MAG: hypothetical protein AAF804_06450 [Bacteroidota bacterium]